MTKDTEDLEIKSQWGQEAKSDTRKSSACREKNNRNEFVKDSLPFFPQKTYHLTSPQRQERPARSLCSFGCQVFTEPSCIHAGAGTTLLWLQQDSPRKSCLSSSGCSEPPAQGCYLLPESLLPQGNILPPRPSTEKCSSNHRFQSSACWDPKLIHFLRGRTWQQPRQQPRGRRASGLSFGGQQLLYL